MITESFRLKHRFPYCFCRSLLGFWVFVLANAGTIISGAEITPPNIIFILADDLGYGDVHCLNPGGKILTPNLDRLAAEGMIFTDAHSTSSVCTPSRYSLLTGRYNWRSRLQHDVLGGLSPPLIEQGRLTVASLLQHAGYSTACMGKWHLGMDWVRLQGKSVEELGIETHDQVRNVDFHQPIRNSPTALGFDYFFGISASLDMVPYTFIENDRVLNLPTEDVSFPLKPNDKGQTRRGPGAPGFKVEQVLPELTRRATDYITQHAQAAKQGKPFFLYLPLTSPHTPIAPTSEWSGKSGLNAYADFVMQTDASVGRLLEALRTNGIASNTFVIFSSDNGCSPAAGFSELNTKGHKPSYVFRGAKADIFEGGHRIPFIARWPSRIRPGTKSDQLICLMDFMATVSEMIGKPLPAYAAEDSVSFLSALSGRAENPLREALVHHSINGSFSIRQGYWKLELCPDSGGWSEPRPGSAAARKLSPTQLYNIQKDIAEQHNVAKEHPDIVERLTKLLQRYISEGRSTPGPIQTNSVVVKIRKETTK
jgi:arylsulfatase A-like enzyme